MNKDIAFKINLPKWCQMVVSGEDITEDQALEIIRRTDSAFYGNMYGNDIMYVTQAEKILNKPKYEDFNNYNEYTEKQDEWEDKWGLIKDLEYLKNGFVSCSWVGGTHGWCNPNGKIEFCNNIGKWASVEGVYNEWCLIAKEFPFLNLTCTLMNGEEDYCDKSLVTIKVCNGEVEFIDTIPYEKLEFRGKKYDFNNSLDTMSENYFSLDQLQKWYDEIFKK